MTSAHTRIGEMMDRTEWELSDELISRNRDQIKAITEQVSEASSLNQTTAKDEAVLPEKKATIPDNHNAIVLECDVVRDQCAGSELEGLTFGIKDSIALQGIPMRFGTHGIPPFVPTEHAAVIESILSHGGRLIMKTNLDELTASGKGRFGTNGPVLHPEDDSRLAGGSSGGSAVVVARGDVDVALGTDTGGSVRIPAAFCGVIGLKPTNQITPLTGVLENSFNLDAVGILARDVASLRRTLDTITSTSGTHVNSRKANESNRAFGNDLAVSEVTVGISDEVFDQQCEDDIQRRMRYVIGQLENAGVELKRISTPSLTRVEQIKRVVHTVEFAHYWISDGIPFRRHDLVDPAFCAWVNSSLKPNAHRLHDPFISRFLAGVALLDQGISEQYIWARKEQLNLRKEMDQLLQKVDVVLLPTTPIFAPKLNDMDTQARDFGRYTQLANVTGHPSISIPVGASEKLPVGLQLIAGRFEEETILGVCELFQQYSIDV